MFLRIFKTAYPPEKPLMVWDGNCPFCRYWIIYLSRFTGDRVAYAPYQDVGNQFKDIPTQAFRESVQFIETNGSVYQGLDAAYRSFYYGKKPLYFLHRLYAHFASFASASDWIYHLISNHRPLMYQVTICFFGKNPKKLKPYWLLWFGIGMVLIFWSKRKSSKIA